MATFTGLLVCAYGMTTVEPMKHLQTATLRIVRKVKALVQHTVSRDTAQLKPHAVSIMVIVLNGFQAADRPTSFEVDFGTRLLDLSVLYMAHPATL